jgi:hypothetical protein
MASVSFSAVGSARQPMRSSIASDGDVSIDIYEVFCEIAAKFDYSQPDEFKITLPASREEAEDSPGGVCTPLRGVHSIES